MTALERSGDPKGRQWADRLSEWSGVTYAATAGQHTALPVAVPKDGKPCAVGLWEDRAELG